MSKHELKAAVYNALEIGPQNAKSRRALCLEVGCRDRVLRQLIEELRHDYPIITDDDGTGYYIPTADARGRRQTVQWIERQKRRQSSIQTALRGAERFARAVNGDGVRA